MATPILEVRDISKKYRITHLPGGYLSLRDRVVQMMRFQSNQREDFLALDGVSFDVMEGDAIAIVGRNGAGKSTLLKILSRITPPTQGRILARGRIASLLEVGTGFHQELTGRENIFFNGSLLGMKRKEIQASFDAIIDFSGTERFLDTPLKHYSSGMQLRLAFAVAAFLEPEILIVDEVLAVGDAEFQRKCLNKMEDVTRSGRTVLFVSHNMAAVQNLCRRALLLDAGKLIATGDVPTVLDHYRRLFEAVDRTRFVSSGERKELLYFNTIEVKLNGAQPVHQLEIACELVSRDHHKDAFLAFDISNSTGTTIMQAIPKQEPFVSYSNTPQRITVGVELPPLIPDVYRVSAWVGSHNTETFCWQKDAVDFEITESPSPGRNFPHTTNHGFLVPHSTITYQ